MYECKYCGAIDNISRKYKVCGICIKLCVKDEERNYYVMDFTTWEQHKDQITHRKEILSES